jgi:high-affinity iron transporter
VIAVVLALFLGPRNGRAVTTEEDSKAETTGTAGVPAEAAHDGGRSPVAAMTWLREHNRNRWLGVGAVALVVVLVAGGFLLFGGGATDSSSETVTITADACAPDFTSLEAGQRTFTVVNKSGRSGEVLFVRSTDQGALGELASIGPGTQRTLSVTVPTGSYAWRCQMSGAPVRHSVSLRATGGTNVAQQRMFAVPPLQPNELDQPIKQYQTYVSGQLGTLVGEVTTLRTALDSDDVAAARTAWLPAQLTWERVGAAYDSFGDLATAIDGGPDGLPQGVHDAGFTGLRRIEYGLWHGQPAAGLAPFGATLAQDVATLRQKMPGITAAPTDMTIRVHEILEDALRDHLSGMSDQGSGAAFPETLADVDGTRVVLAELAPLITERKPGLVDTIGAQLDTLQQALLAARHNGVWDDVTTAPLAERQRVNAGVGQVLENLAQVPDLLEIGAS